MRTPRTALPLALTLVVMVLAAACGGGSSSGSASASPSGAAGGASPSVVIDGLYVTDAWVRPPMGPDVPGAGYLTIHNTFGNDDALVGVASPVATSVEIHESMAGDSGMMGMQPVDRIDVKVGSTVTLEPGGYHLMLMGVTDMPAVGGTVDLTLSFERAGDIVVQAEVRAG